MNIFNNKHYGSDYIINDRNEQRRHERTIAIFI